MPRVFLLFLIAVVMNITSALSEDDPKAARESDPFEGKKAGQEKTLAPGIKFRWCPPGTFMMGEDNSTYKLSKVSVQITKGFWLGETEVTQGQWKLVMGTAPWKDREHSKIGADLAASWILHGEGSTSKLETDSALEFCRKLSEKERELGRLPEAWSYNLPTEAQWEYACRAGTNTKYSFGDDGKKMNDYAWWGANLTKASAYRELWPHRVGIKKANPWGFRDMYGNVWEWCLDKYERQVPGGADPIVEKSEQEGRVCRGGAWVSRECDSATRHCSPFTRGYDESVVGFRVACVRIVAPANPKGHFFGGSEPGEKKEISPGIVFRWCPAGEFLMGSPPTEMGSEGVHEPNERTVQVKLSKGFWLAETELTQGQWKAVMKSAPWDGKKNILSLESCPATFLDHESATRFCETISVRERTSGALPFNWNFVLPTEAQWEYACRAGTSTAFSFGVSADEIGDYAWWGGHLGMGNTVDQQYPHQCGMKKANAWGLKDMHGNVWEWCADTYVEKYPGGLNPLSRATGKQRVARGGDWINQAAKCRCAERESFPSDYKASNLGFRLACVESK